jgi:hypothetical protein
LELHTKFTLVSNGFWPEQLLNLFLGLVSSSFLLIEFGHEKLKISLVISDLIYIFIVPITDSRRVVASIQD